MINLKILKNCNIFGYLIVEHKKTKQAPNLLKFTFENPGIDKN